MASVEDILAEVDAWFAEEVQRAPLSYNTEIYNQVYEARASLKNRLSVVMTGQPLQPPEAPDAGDPGSTEAIEPEIKPSDPPADPGKASSKSKAG